MMKCAIGSFVLFSCLFGASTGYECFKRGTAGFIHYNGKKNVTTSGSPCQRWEIFPSEDENYCRSFFLINSGAIGCYTDPSSNWEVCDIPECDVECFVTSKYGSTVYNGQRNVTASGIPCQRWDVNTPHIIPYSQRGYERNYCRRNGSNPEIICYTTDPSVPSEVCEIPECGTNQTTITTTTPAIPETTASVSSVPMSGVNTAQTSQTSLVETTTTSVGTLPTSDEQTSSKLLDRTTTTPVECATPVQTTVTNASVCLLSTSDLQDRQLYWYNFFHSNLSKAERDSILEKEKEAIRKELLLDTKLLTSYVRKKRCAEDNRYSAQAIGRVGIGFMVTIAVLIVLSDLISCFKFIK